MQKYFMKNKRMVISKAILLIVFLHCSISNLQAARYYFSTTAGDDSRSSVAAQNAATPWQSVNKLNSFFNQLNPGDSVLFKAGEIFYGSIVINKSGSAGAPIIFSVYGGNEKPQITGYTTPSGWANAGGNVWETQLPAPQQNVASVLVDNTFRQAGRYPNANVANNGFLTLESASGNTSITDLQLGGTPNWTGGEVVIRKVRWVLDRNIITQHQQNTIYYNSQSGYGASPGYGYFIQNHPQTLDIDGEWYYQSGSRKFGLYHAGGSPASGSVKVSTAQSLVTISNQANVSFNNLIFSGANANAFDIYASQNIRITNCEMLYSGHNAINALNTNYITIEASIINKTNNVACNLDNCNNVTLKKNTITNTGAYAGMGDGDSGGYEGLLLSGSDQLIEGNTIDSTGYIAVTFRGNNVVVKNNVITNFSFVKDDGSGIYTWNNPSNPPVYSGRVITGNIVLNGLGAGAGTPDPDKLYANGVYMDDNAGGVEISGNTVANCANRGLYIHNAHDLVITNNTVYNNATQIEINHDDIAPFPIRNVTLTGNTFVSKLAAQSLAEFKTNANDISSFGTFDNNYYSRPLYDYLQIGVLHKENGNYVWNAYNLETWKTIYGKDQNSKKSPFPIAPYKVNTVTGSNLFTNGSFNNNINGLYTYSTGNNATASWSNGVLDGGALRVAFSNLTGGDSYATVVINVGTVSAAKKYLLKFSLSGTNENKLLDAYLRKSNAPYSDIASRSYVNITGGRTEQEVLLLPTVDESAASIGFKIPEQNGSVYFDNIQLVEANVTVTNPDDSIRFVYNPETGSKSFALNNTYADIANNTYNSSITVAPYSSAVLLKKSSNQPTPDTVVCSATGSILREQWNNLSGNDVSNIPVQTAPASASQLTVFESQTNVGDNYGARIRGYVCPPQTGNYIFYIAADDASELWLSTDDNPANKSKIAYALSWTNVREWNKYASQKSAAVYLQAGHKYYIEALHKEGGGGDNLAVAWQLPNGSMEAPIYGSRLSPFLVAQLSQSINFPAIAPKTFGDAPFVISASASSGLPVNFTIVSGPATVSGNIVTLTAAGTVIIKAFQAGNTIYSEAPPVMQNVVVNPAATANCSGTGTILREQWSNISGHLISSIPLQNMPDKTMQLTRFESPVDVADNYGARIRGYICPPQTGNYIFYIAADDVAELWLSTSNAESGKVKIASVPDWTASREWSKYPSQKSVAIYLQAGHQYYIEALQKEGEGGDNLAVAWQLPDGTMEAPIAGTRLSPLQIVVPVTCGATGTILREQWNNIGGHNISSIPLQTPPAVSSQLLLFESPTDVAENYGARIRGYICPPQTGNYTFYIAADDAAELWLSTNKTEAGKTLIANVSAYTGVREWNKYASQKSALIYLRAGQQYYIEALQKEGEGGDNLAVAWQLPDGPMEAPMPGMRLAPFETAGTTAKSAQEIRFTDDSKSVYTIQQNDEPVLNVYPNPITTSATIAINLQEEGLIKLELLDEKGIIIRLLFNGLSGKRSKAITLNAGTIKSGLYVVRLITREKVISRKIIILR